MTDRQYFVEGVGVDEEDDRQYFVQGIGVDEDQADAPAGTILPQVVSSYYGSNA